MKEVKAKNTKAVIGNAVQGAEAYFVSTDASTQNHIGRILRDMYKDPIMAVGREIIANGIDACDTLKPEIFLPTKTSPEFRVRDFGPGMPTDKLVFYLAGYGNSKKRGDETKIGGFGIGAKCGFAYANSFTYESIFMQDGKKYRTVMLNFLDENDESKYTLPVKDEPLADSDPTPTGITVSVPVKASDCQEFSKRIAQLCISPSFRRAVRVFKPAAMSSSASIMVYSKAFPDTTDIALGQLHARVGLSKVADKTPIYDLTELTPEVNGDPSSVKVSSDETSVTIGSAVYAVERFNLVPLLEEGNVYVVLSRVPYVTALSDLEERSKSLLLAHRAALDETISLPILVELPANANVPIAPNRESIKFTDISVALLLNCIGKLGSTLYEGLKERVRANGLAHVFGGKTSSRDVLLGIGLLAQSFPQKLLLAQQNDDTASRSELNLAIGQWTENILNELNALGTDDVRLNEFFTPTFSVPKGFIAITASPSASRSARSKLAVAVRADGTPADDTFPNTGLRPTAAMTLAVFRKDMLPKRVLQRYQKAAAEKHVTDCEALRLIPPNARDWLSAGEISNNGSSAVSFARNAYAVHGTKTPGAVPRSRGGSSRTEYQLSRIVLVEVSTENEKVETKKLFSTKSLATESTGVWWDAASLGLKGKGAGRKASTPPKGSVAYILHRDRESLESPRFHLTLKKGTPFKDAWVYDMSVGSTFVEKQLKNIVEFIEKKEVHRDLPAEQLDLTMCATHVEMLSQAVYQNRLQSNVHPMKKQNLWERFHQECTEYKKSRPKLVRDWLESVEYSYAIKELACQSVQKEAINEIRMLLQKGVRNKAVSQYLLMIMPHEDVKLLRQDGCPLVKDFTDTDIWLGEMFYTCAALRKWLTATPESNDFPESILDVAEGSSIQSYVKAIMAIKHPVLAWLAFRLSGQPDFMYDLLRRSSSISQISAQQPYKAQILTDFKANHTEQYPVSGGATYESFFPQFNEWVRTSK